MGGELAGGADGERHLVAGAAFVGGAGQDVACHEEEGRVVVELTAGIATNFGHGVAKGGEDVARDFEAEDVALGGGVGRVGGQAAGAVTGDELLHFARGLGAGAREPSAFGFAGGDAG